jgi:hypothetical protein
MNTLEIYKLASNITEKEVNKIISFFSAEKIKTYNSLIMLGDTPSLACATVLASSSNDDNDVSEFYRFAYC